MATRRQLRAQRDEAEALADSRLARIRELEKALDAVGTSREGSTRREGGMADRIIQLTRELAAKDKALQAALQRAEDATCGRTWDAPVGDDTRPQAGSAR